MAKILSIIVPVYNVENYLERCILSILNQDIPHDMYEIIIINDGSTDNSYNIAKQLERKHNNIRVFTQKNKGLSGARNAGLKKAIGKYIMFVDSDDYLNKNKIKKIIKCAEEYDLDICAYTMKVLRPNGSYHIGGIQPLETNRVYSGKEALLKGLIIASVCINLYRKNFLEENHLFFTEGLTKEDVDFNSRAYIFVKRIMFTDVCAYTYYWNDNSLNRSTNYAKVYKSIIDELHVIANIREYINKKNIPIELNNLYSKRFNSLIISYMLKFICNKSIPKEIVYDFIKISKNYGFYPINGKSLSWKTTILIPFLNMERLYKLFL